MKKMLVFGALFFMLVSCSADEAREPEKGSVEKATDKVATEMVEKIQAPIDKARAVKAAEEQRAQRLKEQSQ